MKRHEGYYPDLKDESRIQNLVSQAMWSRPSMIKKALGMAKLITDHSKAVRRGKAARDLLGEGHIVSIIFFTRALELNCPEYLVKNNFN